MQRTRVAANNWGLLRRGHSPGRYESSGPGRSRVAARTATETHFNFATPLLGPCETPNFQEEIDER